MTIVRTLPKLRKMSDFDAALAFWLLFAGTVAAREPFRQLKGPEISSKTEGMEFTDEVHFTELFNPDNTLAIISMDARKTGTWRVSHDELCLLAPEHEERCYGIWGAGRNIELRREGIDITEQGILQ